MVVEYAYIQKVKNKRQRTLAEYWANTVLFRMLIYEGYSWCKAWDTIGSLGGVSIEANSVMERVKAENIKGSSKDRDKYIDKLWTIFRSEGDPSLELIREIRDAHVDRELNGREWFSGSAVGDFYPSPEAMNERYRMECIWKQNAKP